MSGVNTRGVRLGVLSLELSSARNDVGCYGFGFVAAATSAELLDNERFRHVVLGNWCFFGRGVQASEQSSRDSDE